MIDSVTGTLCFDDGLVLGPKTCEHDFLSSTVGRNSKDNGHNDGWSRYWLPRPQVALSVEWACNVFFFQECLTRLSLAIYEPTSGGWNGWSEAQELILKRRHDDLLLRELGPPPYRYCWGEVFSNYDPRSASSSIGITYLIDTPCSPGGG
jgi:hypothetical protein